MRLCTNKISFTFKIFFLNNKVFYFIVFYATVAQLVEQLICNQSVGGSSPLGGSVFWFLKNYDFGGDARAAKGSRL